MTKRLSKRGRVEGRPPEYDPKYCQAFIAHLAKGHGLKSFGSTIGFSHKTIENWAKQHEEFAKAKELGLELNLLFYEKVGIAGMLGKIKGFNVTAWIFTMKNRHGWRDKHDVEHSGSSVSPALTCIVKDYTKKKK